MTGLENGIGLEIVLWFQTWRTPLIETIDLVFDFLGNEDFVFLILPLVYWCYDARLGRRVVFLFSVAGWILLALKDLIGEPRPYMVSDLVRSMDEPLGYGLPSWHVGMSVVLWGMIGTKIRRRWFTGAVIVFVLLMMVSRLSMGVHFPQDVIVGALLGLAWLGLYLRFEDPISTWLKGKAQAALITGLVVLLTLLYPVLIKPLGQIEMDGIVTLLATFWGGMIGVIIETHIVRFSTDGEWWKRVLRFVLGIAVFMAIRVGLDIAFEGLEPAELFRSVRYVLAGLWVGLGAPWLFVKVGLAKPENAT